LLVWERPPLPAGPAAPAAVHPIPGEFFPGFGTTCWLRWRGDLVQERHGDHPQATRAISSQTPMWWTAKMAFIDK